MIYVIVALTACGASALTFFTGFGLGTILLPAFALFFSVPVAITLTAIVHFLNGLFKLALVGRHAAWSVVLRFGVPAILAAFAGARVLVWLSGRPPLVAYSLAGRQLQVTPVKLIVAALMVFFALVELSSRVKRWSVSPRYLPVGGVVSGFFGGLSGHQGAFRSAFLLRLGLGKEAFIGTSAAIAAVIDMARIPIYLTAASWAQVQANLPIVLTATLAAFLGALAGNRLLKKITIQAIQVAVAVMLIGLAAALASGLL